MRTKEKKRNQSLTLLYYQYNSLEIEISTFCALYNLDLLTLSFKALVRFKMCFGCIFLIKNVLQKEDHIYALASSFLKKPTGKFP